jgi:isoprenylcysteine carboxyl methyltransferase (ICMT) family protein YpbQ
MDVIILIIFLLGTYIRCMMVPRISSVNEFKLKNNNAKEYGQRNSFILAALQLIFYYGSITEACIRKSQIDNFTFIGILLYIFSFIILFYVIKQLNGFWTTKIIIADNHQLNTSFLFKYIKHPNYFLNLIPELIGLALICKAFFVFISIFPLYFVTLIIRIFIEERAMKTKFANY